MRTILDYIRFISRRNLIFPAAVIVVMAILLIVLPVREMLFPASVSSVNEIIERIDNGDRYLNIDISGLTYSGYDFYKGNSSEAAYFYILDEDAAEPACLFLLLPIKQDEVSEVSGNAFAGRVRILKNDVYFSKFLNDFSTEIGWSSDGLSAICHRALLSRYDYHPVIFIILGILIVIVMIISIIYCLTNVITIIDPTRHEACKRLKRFGLDASDFRQIDSELKNNCIIRAGTLYITEHYLVAYTSRSIFVIPLYNIVWVYKYSTLKRFSRSGILNYSLMVITEPEDRVMIPGCSKKDADTVLKFMHRNFRHITVGYSEENRRKFEKK